MTTKSLKYFSVLFSSISEKAWVFKNLKLYPLVLLVRAEGVWRIGGMILKWEHRTNGRKLYSNASLSTTNLTRTSSVKDRRITSWAMHCHVIVEFYTISFLTSEYTLTISITKTSSSVQLRKTVVVCSENVTKYINTFGGVNAELLNVNALVYRVTTLFGKVKKSNEWVCEINCTK